GYAGTNARAGTGDVHVAATGAAPADGFTGVNPPRSSYGAITAPQRSSATRSGSRPSTSRARRAPYSRTGERRSARRRPNRVLQLVNREGRYGRPLRCRTKSRHLAGHAARSPRMHLERERRLRQQASAPLGQFRSFGVVEASDVTARRSDPVEV